MEKAIAARKILDEGIGFAQEILRAHILSDEKEAEIKEDLDFLCILSDLNIQYGITEEFNRALHECGIESVFPIDVNPLRRSVCLDLIVLLDKEDYRRHYYRRTAKE